MRKGRGVPREPVLPALGVNLLQAEACSASRGDGAAPSADKKGSTPPAAAAPAAAAPANGNQTGPLTPEVVKAYLNKHSVEAKLQAAIDKVVAEMPDDPLPFIAAQLTK